MHRLTAKQSKTARSLLKWNPHDLANRAKGVAPQRISHFERGMKHLEEWENDELVKAFKKSGILFKADFGVVLEKEKSTQNSQAGMRGEGAHIVVDADQVFAMEKRSPEDVPQTLEEIEKSNAEKKKQKTRQILR